MARSLTTVPDDLRTSANFGIASTGTISCWAKTAFSPGSSTQNFWWGSGDGSGSLGDQPSFQHFTDNKFYIGFANGGNTRVVFNDTAAFTSGIWQNYILTWTAALQKVYFSGVSKGQQAFTFSAPTPTLMGVGCRSLATTFFINGSVADFAYWNIVLSAGEISALVRGVRPNRIRSGSLIAWYPLEGLQSPEPDFSGNRLNLTVTGTVRDSGPPINMFTSRRPQIVVATAAAPPPPTGTVYRRTLSPVGTRAGSRQMIDGLS